jgi:acyl-CoA synthetase (AMP-forming)/AMP-acid ligase II
MLAAISEEQLARPRNAGSLRVIAHGGSPVATETLRRAHLAFPDATLLHMYGATETAPIATTFPQTKVGSFRDSSAIARTLRRSA